MDLAGASDSGLDGTTLTKLAISPARRQLVKGVHELTDTDTVTVHPAGIFQEFLGVRAALGRMMICAAPAIKYSILIPMRSGLRLQQPQATNTIIDTKRGQQQQVNARQEAKSQNRYQDRSSVQFGIVFITLHRDRASARLSHLGHSRTAQYPPGIAPVQAPKERETRRANHPRRRARQRNSCNHC